MALEPPGQLLAAFATRPSLKIYTKLSWSPIGRSLHISLLTFSTSGVGASWGVPCSFSYWTLTDHFLQMAVEPLGSSLQISCLKLFWL